MIETNKLIFKQIPKAMADMGALAKERFNVNQRYNFRGIDDVYNHVHAIFSKHEIFTTTDVLQVTREERPSKSGGVLIYTILKIEFTFWASDGSSVQCTTIGEGMDSGDKGSNKAMAVAHKYAILQVFCIPTEEQKDPENEHHEVAHKLTPPPIRPSVAPQEFKKVVAQPLKQMPSTRCSFCNSPLTPSKDAGGNPYCKPCFIAKKEAQKGSAPQKQYAQPETEEGDLPF